MRLIGMLDSPYVRRTAISLDVLGVAFTHEAVSVLSTFAQFQAINPVVKAPTLVCDDGEVLMDSSLIIQYAEALSGKSLLPREALAFQHALRGLSLALAACEKSVQIIYERKLRPVEMQYAPWLERVTGQMLAAYVDLEKEVVLRPDLFSGELNQAAISAAVAWQFTQSLFADIVPAEKHPGLVALSARLEQMPAFLKYPPDGPGVVVAT